jgi:hypothetical protein
MNEFLRELNTTSIKLLGLEIHGAFACFLFFVFVIYMISQHGGKVTHLLGKLMRAWATSIE